MKGIEIHKPGIDRRGLTRTGSISKRHLKAIWALAHRAGLQEEDLHIFVESLTGKKSIRSLTGEEAKQVIRALLLKAGAGLILFSGREKAGRVTRAQMAMLGGLADQMGWDGKRLLGLARRMYGVKRLMDLEVKQASGLIEALKAMKQRMAA